MERKASETNRKENVLKKNKVLGGAWFAKSPGRALTIRASAGKIGSVKGGGGEV